VGSDSSGVGSVRHDHREVEADSDGVSGPAAADDAPVEAVSSCDSSGSGTAGCPHDHDGAAEVAVAGSALSASLGPGAAACVCSSSPSEPVAGASKDHGDVEGAVSAGLARFSLAATASSGFRQGSPSSVVVVAFTIPVSREPQVVQNLAPGRARVPQFEHRSMVNLLPRQADGRRIPAMQAHEVV
jgi:hypothetical protein